MEILVYISHCFVLYGIKLRQDKSVFWLAQGRGREPGRCRALMFRVNR